MSREVVIVDGSRTAFGRRGGTLKDFLPTDLSALAVRGLLEKTKSLKEERWTACFAAAPSAT